MDYEKKYKETLERAKQLLRTSVAFDKFTIERVFPELKENKKEWIEKIRQELKSYLEHREIKQISESDAIQQWIAWLDKQGKKEIENKFVPKFNVGDEIKIGNEKSLTITKIDEKGYWSEDLFICSFEDSAKWELVGKLIDNIEPKFKVGDWICNDMCDVHIASIEDGMYYFDEGDGLSIVFVDEHYHLWTIEDAMDGDVLFHSDSSSNGIFIFKEIIDKGFAKEVICYCDYDSEDGFCLGEKHTCCWTDAKILHPASKEQRNLLFKKIEESGYEFDFETKELNKIENDLTEFENALADVCRGWIGEELGWKDYIIKNSLPLLEFAKKQFDEYEQKSVWSEEDERRLNFCLNILRPKTLFGSTEITNIDTINTKWLKSLKDRIQPHKQWKPSEEQIKAFEHFVRSIGESGYASLYENNTKLLYSLLEQLKKL